MDAPPNLTHPSEVRSLLARLDFHPSRVLGQNFLIDRNILQILIQAADLHPGESIVEVGPGLGVLTEALLDSGVGVTAIEKDRRLAALLRERLADRPRLDLIQADILTCDLGALFTRPGAKLVANLPYAIAARLLVELTALPTPPVRIVVTIQREVAERLVAAPATRDYGLLSILVQRPYAVRILKPVSRTCFWPAPDVQSSIVRLDLRSEPLGGAAEEDPLRHLLRHVFSQRRKTLARSLKDLIPDPLPALRAAGIDPGARAEQLPPEAWPGLLRALPDGSTRRLD